MSVVMIRFDAATLTAGNVNANFEALAAAVNGLNGEIVLSVGAIAAGGSQDYVPKTGGAYLGQISAPALLIGPAAGPLQSVVTKADAATAVANLAQTIAGSYSQAQVQALSTKVDELLAKLRTAGFIAP